MNTFQTEIGGVDVRTLAEQFGTPLYVYDRAVIEKRIAELKSFPTIRYAQKANSNLSILALMRKHGVKVDAVSVGEIHRALAAGYSPADVVYTADVFDRTALEKVVELGVHVNCGSPDMIAQYGKRKGGGEVTIRVNPGFGHGHSQKTNTGGDQSKHGIWHEEIESCLEIARKHGVAITGLHMHIGSGTDFKHLAQVGAAMLACAKRIGPQLEMISTGGGLPTPYRPEDVRIDVAAFCELWLKQHQEIEAALGKKLELEVEPGRYLVAESGHLVAEIRAVKKQGERLFYLLNAGFHNLARPILYGAYHPMSVCPADRSRKDNGKRVEAVVGGPLCESGDIFTQRDGGFVEARSLPPAAPGDFLVMHCAGAYGFAMSSNYNSYPFAAEAMVSDGKAQAIRDRQSVEDLVRGERVIAFD